MTDHPAFQTPDSMTVDEVADSVARLVWESLSDFLSDGDTEISVSGLGLTDASGRPDAHAAEEALIFLLWAHTRGVQLAFVGKAPDPRVRRVLDRLHRAVLHDMAEHGTPRDQLPLFEQRVGARYEEYHAAAEVSDEVLGRAAHRHITGADARPPGQVRALAERAIAVADPLRDFLVDVELVES
jgi:hypothetical protein